MSTRFSDQLFNAFCNKYMALKAKRILLIHPALKWLSTYYKGLSIQLRVKFKLRAKLFQQYDFV